MAMLPATTEFGVPAKDSPYFTKEDWARWFSLSSQAKRQATAKGRVAQLFYQGLLSPFLSEDNTYIEFDQSFVGGMLRVPLIPLAVERAVATTMAEATFVEPVPIGHTSDDLLRQQAAAMVVAEFDRRNACHENNIILARELITTGVAFKYLYQTEDFVPVVLPADGLDLYIKMKEDFMRAKGHPAYRVRINQNNITRMPDGQLRVPMLLPVTRESIVPMFNVLVETGCDNMDDCTRFAHFEVRPIRWVADQYGDTGFDFGKLRGVDIQDKNIGHVDGTVGAERYIANGGQQTGDSFMAMYGLVRVYDCWQKLETGRWVQTVYVRDSGGYHKIFEGEKEYHTYVRYGSRHTANNFWDNGMVYDATDAARAYCINTTSLQKNFQSSLKDILIADSSMRDNPMTNSFSQVIFANPRSIASIRRLDMPTNAHQVMMDLRRSNEDDVYKIIGLSEASRGIVKSHVSNEALQTSSRIDAGPLGIMRGQIDDQDVRRKYPLVLRMARDTWDEPHMLAVTANRDTAQLLSRVIQGRDLSGIDEMQISESVEMPKTRDERLQVAMALAKNGLFKAPEEFNNFVKFQKGLLPEPTADVVEAERAQLENIWIADGFAMMDGMMAQMGPTAAESGMTPGPIIYVGPDQMRYGQPLIRPTDIHAIHIAEHEQAIRENKFPSGEPLSAALAHLQEHIVALQESDQAAFMQAVERETMMSTARQGGQLALQRMADQSKATTEVIKALATPAEGGQKSGAVRRGEIPKR